MVFYPPLSCFTSPCKIKRDDWEVVEYLKSSDPDLFKSLKKAAKTRGKKGN